MADRRLWTSEEDELVKDLVSRYGTKKWTEVAQDMKKIYPHLTRSSKQIRERWHNHLDPLISREPWSLEEEAIVFDAHRRVGSKWKDIARLLIARTDNAVKNHFYSTLRRSLRRMNKFLGFKNSTNQMKILKPTILGRLVQEGEKSQEARILINRIFQFSKFKPNKTNNNNLPYFVMDGEKQFLQQAIQHLMSFNEQYTPNDRRTSTSSRSIKRSQNHLLEPRRSQGMHRKDASQTEDLSSKEEHIEVKQEHHCQDAEMYGESNWQESQQGYRGLLPELEHPEADEDFLSGECKVQQFFF